MFRSPRNSKFVSAKVGSRRYNPATGVYSRRSPASRTSTESWPPDTPLTDATPLIRQKPVAACSANPQGDGRRVRERSCR